MKTLNPHSPRSARLRRFARPAVAFALALAIAVSVVPAAPTFAEGPAGVVNVNQADAQALALLPRVGPALAGRILEFREENGPFKSIDDLLLVRGIGERTLELMKPYLALEGKTTLEEKVRVSQITATRDDGEQNDESDESDES